MSYTPINWQTGDTITAEKMNKMDNGWGMQETQLFSEAVTTNASDGIFIGNLTYSSYINNELITVIFDGTSYQCFKVQHDEYATYGAPWSNELEAFDFSEYPFHFESNENEGNILITEIASTFNLSISAPSVEVSPDFSAAVNSAVDMPLPAAVIQCVPGVTRIDNVTGKLPFFYEPNSSHLHIITSVAVTCEIFPESNTISAHFSREDGLFFITTGNN